MEPTPLRKIRAVADYQFRRGAGKVLFPREVEIKLSPTTSRIRHIYHRGKLLATLRPTDGLLSLTPSGGERLLAGFEAPRFRVVVVEGVEGFVSSGKSVFARHVAQADPEIRPMEEVVVVDGGGRVLAVGRAILSGREMPLFKRGVAVKVRRGVGAE